MPALDLIDVTGAMGQMNPSHCRKRQVDSAHARPRLAFFYGQWT
jgi:hypothetical protein